ncbi:MAG: bifunctional riboflavin kinase/FAD synthetase [Flavobacteriales bacterium]
MKIHTDFSHFKNNRNSIVTIGTFDGVHPGHQKIIERVHHLAQASGVESVLLTFYPHPRMVLHPEDHDLRLLSTPEEKAELLESTGIDHLMIYPFSPEFARLSAFDYVRDLLVNGLKSHTVVVGYDHRFGRNREGDHTTLVELAEVFGFEVEEISPEMVDSVNISSTKIRQALYGGHILEANKYLGRPYSMRGKVVHGDKIGRQLGFPTANIDLNYKYKLIPAHGIYAVKVDIGSETFNGVMNIGVRPTTHTRSEVTSEVYVLDFDRDIYGQQITVNFVDRIRDEMKFGSIDELKEKIQTDVIRARALFEI